jgi:hypothetical protein
MFPDSASAQQQSLNPGLFTVPSDTVYIEDYTRKLTTRIFIVLQNASFMINPDFIGKIEYKPNINARIGLSGNWKWFGLGFSVENPFYRRDKDVYGSTSFLDFRLNAFGRSVAAEIYYQTYKGFYISSPLKNDDAHYILPDMNTVSLGIAAYWIYNAERFSIRAAFIQNERQKKSAGSFVLRPSFLYYRVDSENGIIPPELIHDHSIPGPYRIKSGSIYSLGLSPGYCYTLVFAKNFYITAALFPGVFWQTYTYQTNLDHFGNDEFSFQLSGRFAAGYNSGKWFAGCSFQTGWNEVPYQLSDVMFNYDVAQYRIWGGTRFSLFQKKKK